MHCEYKTENTCGRRCRRDPRNGNLVMTPAKYIPYARFKTSFRQKINKKKK